MLRRTPLRRKRPTPRRVGAPAPRIKSGREEDPEHLARIRRQPCYACQVDRRMQEFRTEPHHPRPGGADGPGAGQRSSDRDAIPICAGHHRGIAPGYISIHKNPIEFRARYGTEAEIRDRVLAIIYPQEARNG